MTKDEEYLAEHNAELAARKPTWGTGPWQNEPDRVEFEHAGFPCLIVRQPTSGHLCGYVAVPPGHSWHGADVTTWKLGKCVACGKVQKSEDYDEECNEVLLPCFRCGDRLEEYDGPSAHGGITYAEACRGNVCHHPKPGDPDDVWWVGFDAAHSGDVSPDTLARVRRGEWRPLSYELTGAYKTVSFMRSECERLAEQAKVAK